VYGLKYLYLGIHSNPKAGEQQTPYKVVYWHYTKGVAESLQANKIRDRNKWCHESSQRAMPESRSLQVSQGLKCWPTHANIGGKGKQGVLTSLLFWSLAQLGNLPEEILKQHLKLKPQLNQHSYFSTDSTSSTTAGGLSK